VRRRLIVTTTGLVLVAVLALAVPLALAVRGVLATRAIDTVQGVAEQAGLFLDVTARTCAELQLRVAQLAEAPASLTVLATDRTLVASTAAGPVAVNTDAFAEAATAGRVGRSIADGRITVAAPLATTVCGQPLVLHATQDDAELRAAVRGAWLAIAGVAVVVAAGAAAFAGWSARRLAQPFESLATSARALGDGDFSTRAPRSGLPEADAIAEALDGTAERLGRAVERASAFTADASHQLRTPLTALRLQLDTAQALLAAGDGAGEGAEGTTGAPDLPGGAPGAPGGAPDLPGGALDMPGGAPGAPGGAPDGAGFRTSDAADRAGHLAAALAAAEVEADRVEATIEDLVALTRLDGPDTEVELPALVAARLDGWRALAAEQGREVTVEVAESIPVVRARPGAIAQILQVLLDNALLHAGGPVRVEVAVARGTVGSEASATVRVCVVDRGPVAASAEADASAEPAASTGPDASVEADASTGPAAEDREPPTYTRIGGKGLPLARSLAAAEGGQLTVTSEGSGTRACLLLPAAGGVGSTREPSTSPQ
jgi:signal transduction histidine kinase